MTTTWPLTGRTRQLEELGRVYRDRACGGVVLQGPAGVGKSRLAEEAAQLAERGGRPVARAVAHSAARDIPLGALAHLLPADLGAGLGVGDDERTVLFHAARAQLGRMAGDDRLVLLVDDVDLLDDTSVAVLVPLITARTVFLVATVRSDRRPSSDLVRLYQDGHLVRLEVGPLEPEQVGTLLHRVLDGPVSDAARDELARVSGGNLQVLTELVRGARERDVLVQTDGAWTLTGPLPTTVALDELVAETLADVDPAGRAVLEVLVVCERFGLADIERVHGAATLEALEAKGLIVSQTSGNRRSVRLAHPLYGEVLRAGLPPLRLRRVQAELADLIEGHGARRRDDLAPLALWRVASGGRIDPDRLLRAGRLALAGHDPALATRLMHAPDAAALPPVDRGEVLVEAHAMTGDREEVDRTVASIWDEPMADARRVQLAKRRADTCFYGARDLPGALAALDAARERLRDDDTLAAVDAHRASLLASAGRPGDALRIAESMGQVASARTRVELAGAVATSLLSVGRYDEARAVAHRAAEDRAELPDWLARRGAAQHVVNEGHALAYAGRYAEARELLEPASARARDTGALGAQVWFDMALAEIARDTGRGHKAVRRFREVVALATKAGQHAALVWAHVGVAQGHLLLGQCSEAAVALARADAAGDSPVATSVATRERTRAWLDACRGDLRSARQRVRDTIPDIRDAEVFVFEAALLHDLVRLGVAAEAVDRLEALAADMDGPLVAIHAAHARAVVDHDAGALRAVVGRYEAIDALGLAAEAAAEQAELHRAGAEARAAAAARQRAAELADRAGGLRTPPLARGTGVVPLTAREREVALLAALGRTSREIGEHLGVSTRTVDTHLARVYRKLGIAGRAELADALEG